VRDIHSYANPQESRVRHVNLRLNADFTRRRLSGSATLDLDLAGQRLVLDTRGLEIHSVDRPWRLGAEDPILGSPLEIDLRPGDRSVTVEYSTGAEASALQWLDGGAPFLFTQSQAIHARSWAPVQDSPGVRFTWSAQIEAPAGLTALASGGQMPVPAYLMALAVGHLEFAPVSERAGVWAPPALLARARDEFSDMERMIQATERLYGPYRWGRHDVLVMPPSFPFGGMENPCLTFATPTILAGDKSLVSLVAHELAHSWSGNLVTNATWRDFWLNEGFTTYIERRIQEEIYGERRARMEAAIEMSELRREMARLPESDQVLAVDLDGRDPDDGCTLVPYVKGAALLRRLEQVHGRERFDRFVRGYFDHFAFRSITTEEFIEYFESELGGYDVRPWIFEPGLPADVPEPQFEFESAPRDAWTTQEWLHWLRALPAGADMAAIDRQWRLTASGNSEILCEWLVLSVRQDYEPAFAKVEEFLCSVGRRKFLKPLYEELSKTGRARAIFEQAQAAYHPIARAEIERMLA
jgi:leukotriene-A4 hydrolase